MSKPFSQACENNKHFICSHIRTVFRPGDRVLEIGSATAQHITHFARQMPRVIWQPSDTAESLTMLLAGLQDEARDNILAPLILDVTHKPWPISCVDGIFSANTLHIMSFEAVECFFSGAAAILARGGGLCVYGPFKYGGNFTSPSNEHFDQWLKQRDPLSGVRDFEDLAAMASELDLQLEADHRMPANNQLLVWRKGTGEVP